MAGVVTLVDEWEHVFANPLLDLQQMCEHPRFILHSELKSLLYSRSIYLFHIEEKFFIILSFLLCFTDFVSTSIEYLEVVYGLYRIDGRDTTELES